MRQHRQHGCDQQQRHQFAETIRGKTGSHSEAENKAADGAGPCLLRTDARPQFRAADAAPGEAAPMSVIQTTNRMNISGREEPQTRIEAHDNGRDAKRSQGIDEAEPDPADMIADNGPPFRKRPTDTSVEAEPQPATGIGGENRNGDQHQRGQDAHQKCAQPPVIRLLQRTVVLGHAGHGPGFRDQAAETPLARRAYSAIALSSAALSKSGQWIGTNTNSL